MVNANPRMSYATFGLKRSWYQVVHTLKSRKLAFQNMLTLFSYVKSDEALIVNQLGRPVENLKILEIGPGQGMERAKYFGIHNEVVGMDLDVIPMGWDIPAYVSLLKRNGIGRLLKTIGRKIMIAPLNDKAWKRIVGSDEMKYPQMIYGNVCDTQLPSEAYDMVMTWSVFEHLPDPEYALKNLQDALRPGGVLFISIHLFTSINGSHDIRAFTGFEDELPLWGHLRPAVKDQIVPSAYLNEWRLGKWRELFGRLAPGHVEKLEVYDFAKKYEPRLSLALEEELKDFSREELFTVDIKYVWRKPSA